MDIEIGKKQEEEPEWLKWWEILKEMGAFSFIFATLAWNPLKKCVTLFDPLRELAVTFYLEHKPDAQYTDSTPDGVRVVRAIGRLFEMEGSTTVEAVLEVASSTATRDNPIVITVEKTDRGRLWSAKIAEVEN